QPVVRLRPRVGLPAGAGRQPAGRAGARGRADAVRRPRTGVMTMATVTVAAVQATPVFLDREATVDKACSLVKEAADAGAELVVFPETFVPGYPDWVWRLPAWGDGRFARRLLDQSVDVPGPVTERLGQAAAAAGTWVAMGVNERVG